MKREIIRVEPLASYWRSARRRLRPSSGTGTRSMSRRLRRPNPKRERSESVQTNARQSSCWKVEALCRDGGIILEKILKGNVYVTSVEMFPAVNEVYRRYFPKDPPARIFVNAPAWNGEGSTSR